MLVAVVFSMLLFSIRASSEGWTKPENSAWVDFDLNPSNSLQLKTDSALGSEDVVYIYFYHNREATSAIWWKYYGGGIKYTVKYCTPWSGLYGDTSAQYLSMTNVPSETSKIWKITKSSTSLKITCNGVEVVNLVYSDVDVSKYTQCASAFGQSTTQIRFWSDSATDLFLPVWQQIAKGVKYYYTDDVKPIRFKTTADGTTDQVQLEFFWGVNWGMITWQFTDFAVQLYTCTDDRYDTTINNDKFTDVPDVADRTWEVSWTTTEFTVKCNDKTVWTYKYTNPEYEDCLDMFSNGAYGELKQFQFIKGESEWYLGDTASLTYYKAVSEAKRR